jgi:hypothetical protein
VWRWFNQHTENGNAPSVTKKLIDREVGVTGFIDAICNVHWMTEQNGTIQVVNFERHNSKSAKNRALTNDRVKRKRNADIVTNALPEKRREEELKKKNIKKKKSQFTDETFQQDWLVEAQGKPKYSKLDLQHEAEQFGLHHGMKGNTFVDWKKALWNWLNNAVKFQKGKPEAKDWKGDLKRMADEAIRLGNAA